MKKEIISMLLFIMPILMIAQNNPSPFIGTNLSRGTELRVLRLAVSCTGEYTQSVHGNDDNEKVAEVLRQMKTWLKEINETYGREYCVRFELIPDNLLKTIIFTDADSDPWPTMTGAGCDGADKIHSIQAKVMDDILGAGNYDFSHVIIANYNGGCGGGFKSAYSCTFDIPVTRHEMGHQFQQGHTINNGGNNNYEPENAGRSIQGGNSHPYAHSASFHQLALHLLNYEANTGSNFPTGNHIPIVNAGEDRAIPINTPFTLSATASDSDLDDQLTYAWDQLDMGVAKSLPNSNDYEGALFSRLLPTSNSSRTFPNMDSLIKDKFYTTIEQLPVHPRDLNFRITVNDNHQINYKGETINASGINSDDIKITVVNNGGAFLVTSQNNAPTYQGGSNQRVTWKVNGTNLSPINAQNVKISLSTDGGHSFPIILSDNTENNGEAQVVIPNINTSLARIKIEAIDNYFFAINSQNFKIIQNKSLPGIDINNATSNLLVSETGQTATYSIGLLTNPSGNVQIKIFAKSQAEISVDGINFDSKQVVTVNDMTPINITVRGKYDDLEEISQTDVIQQRVSASDDITNYPVGMIGQPVLVHIADAQIPPIIGVDFDEANSMNIPENWIKISDIRNQSFTNLVLDDETPTNISLTTNATECGIGGCGFNAGIYSPLPKHAQSLANITGVSYTRGKVTFTWSGLEANTKYRIFIFGLGVFNSMNQTITIIGNGRPVTFDQNAAQGILFVNDKPSTNDLLVNFAKEITSSESGTINIQVTPNSGAIEMSFTGMGICK